MASMLYKFKFCKRSIEMNGGDSLIVQVFSQSKCDRPLKAMFVITFKGYQDVCEIEKMLGELDMECPISLMTSDYLPKRLVCDKSVKVKTIDASHVAYDPGAFKKMCVNASYE